MNGERILVPLNFEQSSVWGLEFVTGLAGEMPVFAALLYVNHLNISRPDCRVHDDLRRESESRLRALAKLFLIGQLPHVRVRVGKPHKEILAEASASDASCCSCKPSTGLIVSLKI